MVGLKLIVSVKSVKSFLVKTQSLVSKILETGF